MIQRIQSLFLLLAAIFGVLSFFIPFWNFNGIDYSYTFSAMGVKLSSGTEQSLAVSTLPIIVLLALHIILCFVSMFSYKNRPLQVKVNSFNVFFTLIIVGTVFLWVPYMVRESVVVEEKWNYGLFLPILSFISLILASRFIKKDEKLVKAADRLR